MKKLFYALILLSAFLCHAAVPEFQRQAFTTNLDAAARNIPTNIALSIGTNNGTLSVNLGHLGRAYQKLDGASGPFKMGGIGDTIPYITEIAVTLTKQIGQNGFDLPFFDLTFTTNGAVTNRAILDGAIVTTNWPGSIIEIGTGGSISFSNANSLALFSGQIYANWLQCRFIRDTGRGTAQMYSRTNGGAWVKFAAFDTSGAHSALWFGSNFPSGWYQLMVSNASAGTLRLPSGGGGMWDTNSTGLTMSGMEAGNLDLSDIVQNSTNISYKMFTNMGLNLCFMSEISGAANYVTYGPALATFATNFFPTGILVQVSPWPLSDATVAAQGEVQRRLGIQYNLPVYDGSEPWKDYFTLTNQSGIDDGTHLTANASKVLARGIWRSTGLEEACAVALANNTKSGAIPFRDVANQDWRGNNTFYGGLLVRGTQGTLTLYDTALDSTTANAYTKLRYTSGVATFYLDNDAALWEYSALIGDARIVPAAAYHNLLDIGATDRRIEKLWLTGGEVGASLALLAPYAATEAGSNAIANLNGNGTNTTLTNAFLLAPNFGPNTNFTVAVSNSSATGPGVWNLLKGTNGAPVGQPAIAVNGTNGNVGIGKASPTVALDVTGSVTASGAVIADTVTVGNSFTKSGGFGLTGTTAEDVNLFGSGFSMLGALYLGTRTSNSLALVISNTPPVFHNRDGTRSNAAPLEVGSSMGRTNWPFVVRSGAFPLAVPVFGVGTNGDVNALGGIRVGAAGSALLTNTLYASATLDFASQTVGGVEDLPITVAGAADGDIVAVGKPTGSMTSIVGSFTGFASNGVVYVRFISTGTAQNPASGTFKVRVDKFQ